MTPSQTKLLELDACMFGTPVDRDPSEGVRRQKRDTDGWRHGKSRSFSLDGKLYGDTVATVFAGPHGPDAVTALYQKLHDDLTARAKAEVAALPPEVQAAAQPGAPKPNPCCNVEGNLVARKDMERPDLSVMVCRVCRCRHFELTVDTAKIVARGAPI